MAPSMLWFFNYRRFLRDATWRLNSIRRSSSDVIYSLIQRGLVKELFPKDSSPIVSSGIPCAYAGFDATSDSLHIGNLLVLVALLHWQRAGNQAIVIVGDSTATVGDPSGHKTERDVLENDLIKKNAESIEQSIYRIFDNHESHLWCRRSQKKKALTPLRVLRNSSWYDQIKAVDLLSTAGRHIRVGDMLSRTSVKLRMDSGEGINFSEFSYQVFQAYDWLHLFNKYKCQFQFGGNDQMGNIVTGYNLISNTHYKNVYGALIPLIQSEAGDKYGKSSGPVVCLNENRTSPFDLYQYLVRIPDREVGMFLKLFTFLELEEVESIVQQHMKNPDKLYGQKKVAEEVLLLVHGEKGLQMAQRATKAFYQCDLDSLVKMDLNELKQVVPSSYMTELTFKHGISLLDLTLEIGCFLNESDANRIITGGGVYINFERITAPTVVITPNVHILPNSTTLLRVGKKTYYLVIWK